MLTIQHIEELANWKILSDHGKLVTFDQLDINNDTYTLDVNMDFKSHILTIDRHNMEVWLDNKKTGVRLDSLSLFLNSLGGTLFVNIGFNIGQAK